MMPKRKKKKKEKELPETFSEGDNRVVLPFSRLMKRTTKLFSFNDTHTLADSIDHSHITIYQTQSLIKVFDSDCTNYNDSCIDSELMRFNKKKKGRKRNESRLLEKNASDKDMSRGDDPCAKVLKRTGARNVWGGVAKRRETGREIPRRR